MVIAIFPHDGREQALGVALGFLRQCEEDAGGIGVVRGLADLIRLFAPGAPDLENGGVQYEDFPASGAVDLGSIPVRLHGVPFAFRWRLIRR